MELKLSAAQTSALECRFDDLAECDDAAELAVYCAWNREARLLVFSAEGRDALFSGLRDASNAEAENPSPDRFTRAAARSFGALASRVLRSC